MQALILVGGRGRRMLPLTNKIPKPLLPVAGKPFLSHQIIFLRNQGIKEFILATGYLGKLFERHFRDGKSLGIKILYSKENKPLDTGGAVKNAEKLIKNEDIFILNGDSFLDFDVRKMLTSHKRNKQPITVAIRKVKDSSRYGAISINKRGIITRFEEKRDSNQRGFINGGVYIVQKKVLKSFAKNKKISLEKDIFPLFNNKIFGFKVKGYFIDIGIPTAYRKANKNFIKYANFH